MKLFKRYKNTSQTSEKGRDQFEYRTVFSAAVDTRENQSVFGMGVAPLNLQGVKERWNANSAKIIDVTANVWNDLVSWRPSFPFRSFLRVRNTTTGADNRTTTPLDLANGTGVHNSGDVYVITWIHDGDQNNNIEEITLWMSRVGADGNSPNSTIRVALFDITTLSTGNDGALDNLAAGVGVNPLNLDHTDYYANSQLAYAERPFNDAPVSTKGAPLTFQLCYNSRENRTTGLVDGNVYAIVVYLNRNLAETNVVHIHGSNVAADDGESATYVGVAGWNGAMGVDNTVPSAFYELNMTSSCVINKITMHADATQNLGDCRIAKIMVMPDDDDAVKNIPLSGDPYGHMYFRELVANKKFGDQVQGDIIFEGKAEIPRRYFLKFLFVTGYTGDVCIDVNYWNDPNGDLLVEY